MLRQLKHLRMRGRQSDYCLLCLVVRMRLFVCPPVFLPNMSIPPAVLNGCRQLTADEARVLTPVWRRMYAPADTPFSSLVAVARDGSWRYATREHIFSEISKTEWYPDVLELARAQLTLCGWKPMPNNIFVPPHGGAYAFIFDAAAVMFGFAILGAQGLFLGMYMVPYLLRSLAGLRRADQQMLERGFVRFVHPNPNDVLQTQTPQQEAQLWQHTMDKRAQYMCVHRLAHLQVHFLRTVADNDDIGNLRPTDALSAAYFCKLRTMYLEAPTRVEVEIAQLPMCVYGRRAFMSHVRPAQDDDAPVIKYMGSVQAVLLRDEHYAVNSEAMQQALTYHREIRKRLAAQVYDMHNTPLLTYDNTQMNESATAKLWNAYGDMLTREQREGVEVGMHAHAHSMQSDQFDFAALQPLLYSVHQQAGELAFGEHNAQQLVDKERELHGAVNHTTHHVNQEFLRTFASVYAPGFEDALSRLTVRA